MKKSCLVVVPAAFVLVLFWETATGQPNGATYRELAQERIRQIAGFLPDQPGGFGRPLDDRAFWSDPSTTRKARAVAKNADALLKEEFPAWDDEAYLEFTKTGQRPRGEAMENKRSGWLAPLVFAECLENKGRFLPLLNKVLSAYADEPTWTMPAHDRQLNSFHRTRYDVDLRTATFGHDLAQALYLLGDRIDPNVRSRVRDALNQRLLEPFKRCLLTGEGCYWLGSSRKPVQNNWNAVCLSGVAGGALILVPDKTERAVYVAAAEHYSQYYFNSIPKDGYCEEGVGYWGYGFGHSAVLREELVRATNGKLDLFASPRIASVALYGVRIRIGEHAVPPFADCRFGTKPDARLLEYCNETLGLGLRMRNFSDETSTGSSVVDALMTATPCGSRAGGASKPEDPLRYYFNDAGVLACRPAPGTGCRLGIGIKAGGNGSHSHNDVGSYAIAVGDDEPTGDPGGPVAYDSKTFGPHRYDYKILNSYGHPVPVVGGQLQIEAAKARPVVLGTKFTAERDEIKMDITSAYNVPGLKQLTRTMDYVRAGDGEIEITDELTCTAPTAFEEALITHGTWKQIDDRTILLTIGKAGLLVTIETPEGFAIKADQIKELAAPEFTRLGIAFNKPVHSIRVKMVFRPAAPAK
jgi:hypothetical protein